MKTNSTSRILVLCVVLLTLNSHYAFSRARPTKPEVDRNQNAVLLIGDHQGVDEMDVQNAVLLVSQELRKQDIRVSDPVHETPASGTVYRVVLRRSNENKKILFRLSEENTAGTIIVEREMLFADIEEVNSAVPRLVYALVHRKPITLNSFVMDGGVFATIVPIEEILHSVEVQAKMDAKRDAETDINKRLWGGVGCAIPFSMLLGAFAGAGIGASLDPDYFSVAQICGLLFGGQLVIQSLSLPLVLINPYHRPSGSSENRLNILTFTQMPTRQGPDNSGRSG